MSLLASHPRIRRFIASISEIWFIVLLLIFTFSMARYLIRVEWQTHTFAFTLLFAISIGLLIKQLFGKRKWVSITFGIIFSIGSFYMILALLSEYSEFSSKTDPNAIKMLTFGGGLFGTSLVLAIRMWFQGVYRISIS